MTDATAHDHEARVFENYRLDHGCELTALCVDDTIDRLGGFWFDDYAVELSAIREGRDGTTAQELVDAWMKLLYDRDDTERRPDDAARHEETTRREAATGAFDEAEDWSDV